MYIEVVMLLIYSIHITEVDSKNNGSCAFARLAITT